ncbi:polar growth protein [Mortierella polycephala]|uniref:Polar growth protein n=1 Tax=Mortierella polycephala TaxID=41804 RepID=A0A9P6QDE9_9FUNG|nr:polar growth protein [Mortierella polycephala]
MVETVWAIHNFEAEAEDEISFHIGEPIIVLQKDELYQDGWWEGTNVQGDTGLFPENYTVRNPPEQKQSDPLPLREPNVNGIGFGGTDNNGLGINTNGKYGNSNANAANSLDHGHSSINNSLDGGNASRVMANQNMNSLNNSVNNMHIHQNPAIASPSMGSTRSGLGGPSNSTASNSVNHSKNIDQTVEESLNDPQLTGHPSSWSIEQVAYWLSCCGFKSVAPSFVDNEISGAILLELNLNNLKELDINSFGKRFNIMSAIAALKRSSRVDLGSKGPYGTMSANPSMYGLSPNIPSRMTSAPLIIPSLRASFDNRGDYMRDPRQDLQDPRNASIAPQPAQSPPSSTQFPTMHYQQNQQLPQHQPTDYDTLPSSQGRSGPLARSDTNGSVLSAGSMSDAKGPQVVQRQSVTSAFSSTSNPQRNQNQWERNAHRPPQMPTIMSSQQRGPVPNEFDDMSYGARSIEQPPVDQYPRPMDRNGTISPEPNLKSSFEIDPSKKRVTKQRKYHNPDGSNRLPNGKADPSDKVVPLDMIGKPDYAGWLKKRGDTYRTWKSRWFMLKGVTLYYMNSPKDNASKDYINLIGYRIIQDENIYAGKYCFKAMHEDYRNFYFYTESESDMKGWLKALMKVTIGRDFTAPVISSSNIPTIPLHIARQMAPRPPSPSKRNRGLGPNGQPMHPQQQQHQQQYEQKYHLQQMQQQQPQRKPTQQKQILDYDDQDSDADGYLPNDYGGARANYGAGPDVGGNNTMNGQSHQLHAQDESPILQHLTTSSQQDQESRNSFIHPDHQDADKGPWREEDNEEFSQGNININQEGQQRQEHHLKNLRPDSELDTFLQHASEPQSQQNSKARWTQEQYVNWINHNLPNAIEPVSDAIQSLRSGVVLVRLIEQLSGEDVNKRIPNATYTLQMLENLLTAFKFMDRVGISTDGYTVKDIFNGNEDKAILMFESIRARFPDDTPPLPPLPPTSTSPSGPLPPAPFIQSPNGSPSPALSNSKIANGNLLVSPSSSSNSLQQQSQHIAAQDSGGSEYEALYDEAARSTIS